MLELSVSIVCYAPDRAVLGATLSTLAAAGRFAHAQGVLVPPRLFLVDNGPGDNEALLREAAAAHFSPDRFRILGGEGNVGYGRGHNRALAEGEEPYHLILNPDVLLAPDALLHGIKFLEAHPDVGLVTPRAHGSDGRRQMLAKRYPSVLDLALRGFAPPWARRPFRLRLHRYEMRDIVRRREVKGLGIVSGCFMLFRRSVLKATGGFDPRFFLYFEDFDLSLRAGRLAQTAYLPQMRIVHAGGGAAGKGAKHIRHFGVSAWQFFSKHGWRWW